MGQKDEFQRIQTFIISNLLKFSILMYKLKNKGVNQFYNTEDLRFMTKLRYSNYCKRLHTSPKLKPKILAKEHALNTIRSMHLESPFKPMRLC